MHHVMKLWHDESVPHKISQIIFKYWHDFYQFRYIRLEGPEDPTSETPDSAVTWPRSRFNTSGPDPLGFDLEDLAASRGTVGGHSGRPPIK